MRMCGGDAPQASPTKLGQAVHHPALAVTSVHTEFAVPQGVRGRAIHGAHTVCATVGKPAVCTRVCSGVSSYARDVPGDVRDMTARMQLLTVEDKCVYEAMQVCTHTETQRQRGCARCMRCATHNCAVRQTWTRSDVLVETKGGQHTSRVGVKLGWGCANVSKVGQSPNLSTTLASSMQQARGQSAARFGLKRKRATIA